MKSNFEFYLKQYLSGIDQETIRIIKNKEDLLLTISNFCNEDIESLKLLFKEFTVNLEKDLFISGWHVKFSSDRVQKLLYNTIIFERILDADKIQRIIELNNRLMKKQLAESIHKLNWKDFELFCYELFKSNELEFFDYITQTEAGADGGVDLKGKMIFKPDTLIGDFRLPLSKHRMVPFAAQIKKEKKKIGRPTVAQLKGDLEDGNQGMVIAANGFSSEAIDFAIKNNIILMSIESDNDYVQGITDLMIQRKVGMSVEDSKIYRYDNFLREIGLDY